MENQVDDKIKHERFKRLLDTLNPIVLKNSIKLDGTVQRVLIEEISKNDSTVLAGRNESGKSVHFKGNSDLIGTLADIKIDSVNTWSLKGYIVEDEK